MSSKKQLERLKSVAMTTVQRQAYTLAMNKIDAKQFSNIVVEAMLQKPELVNASEPSLARAISACSRDGLLPDGQQAAFIYNKHNKTVKYIPMKMGLVKLLYDTIPGSDIEPGHVLEKDKVRVIKKIGAESILEHEIDLYEEDRGKVIGSYVWLKIPGQSTKLVIFDRNEIANARKASKIKEEGGAWDTWTGQMAEKAVIKSALNKYKHAILSAAQADKETAERLMTALDEDEEYIDAEVIEVEQAQDTGQAPKRESAKPKETKQTGAQGTGNGNKRTQAAKKTESAAETQARQQGQPVSEPVQGQVIPKGEEPPAHVTEPPPEGTRAAPAEGEQATFTLPDSVGGDDPTEL